MQPLLFFLSGFLHSVELFQDSFILLCASIDHSFFLLSGFPLYGYTTVPLYAHLSLGCFYILAISNKVAMNTCGQVFVWTCAFFFSWKRKRSKMAGTYGRCVLYFKEKNYLFTYLAVLGLSCGTQDLRCRTCDLRWGVWDL